MELGHLCKRQCISNYVRNVRNMSNNDSIVIVAAVKKQARNECHEIGAAGDEPCCHKSTTFWLSQ